MSFTQKMFQRVQKKYDLHRTKGLLCTLLYKDETFQQRIDELLFDCQDQLHISWKEPDSRFLFKFLHGMAVLNSVSSSIIFYSICQQCRM